MLKSHRKNIFDTLGRNPIHPFPARMAPGIALEALGESKSTLRVLDPMAGSGTVLAVARQKGHRAFGVDVDPLAVMLARAWTRSIDVDTVRSTALEVLANAKTVFGRIPSGQAYPLGSDDETRKFIRYWFDEYSRRQLFALADVINRITDNATRDALWCGFSRLIITKKAGASLAMDLSHSRPHKAFERAPVKPFNRFIAAVDAVVYNCPGKKNGLTGPATVVKQGDARNLDIATGSMDLVITSPPYLNAIDYMRCSKFSLVWMGHRVSDLRRIRGESVGTGVASEEAVAANWVKSLINDLGLTSKLPSRDCAILSQYVWDMGLALAEVSRVLKHKGRAVYVVGDSTVRGTFIRNSSIVAAVAQEHDLSLTSKCSRALPENRRYMPPPKREGSNGAMDGRMRREVVLVFDNLAVRPQRRHPGMPPLIKINM